MSRLILPLLILLLVCASCAPLDDKSDGLVDFTEIPAEWGHLVAVTKHQESGYYELWFSNPETGSLTHAPLQRQTWGIKIDRVRTMPRSEVPASVTSVGGES
jgi:hypothetical protein